jgi:diguanylate cyclase (GGDEF)-like protein/PAS domain S-box-containing protein
VRLCLETPTGVVLFAAGEPPIDAFAVAELESAAGSISGGPLGHDSRLQLDVPVGAACATVFPIAAVNRRRGLIVVASSAPLSPLIAQALQSLADSVSLALGSAELIEDMHRRENEARFGSLVRNASDLITVVDSDGIIGYQSPSIERILGYHPDEVHETSFQELLIAGDRGRLGQLLGMQRRGGAGTYTFECTLCHADGRTIKFEVLATDLLDDEHVRGIVLNGRDVSERTAFQAQLAHQAFHDPVTSLPNRALFSDRVQHALTRADRERATVAVIFLDLDDFKTINDSLGHSAGDDVLREVGRRLVEAIRSTDTAARFGGDEFAVLLEGIEGAQAAADMADRIVAAFEVPVALKEKEIFVRPSLGIALAGPDSEVNPADADELVRNADAAMYIAKRDGKGGYRVFESAMHASVVERLELRAELQRAIDTNQFELYFQPLIHLETGAISGIEALCRWHHPTRGLVQPGQFIPLAEEMGLIVEIGRWVLHEGCRQAAEFQACLPPEAPLRLGINLSVKQLQHPDIVADVREALEVSGLNPGTLVLEITESVMMADAALAARRLHELRALGARIAMDDFGTGYSSLSYLSHFPVDILKMDRSFLTPDVTIQASGLAAAIVSLGSTLSLEVVAEGIERPGQLATLRELGCDTGQGFLIARPMDADATRQWLRETQAGGGFEGRRAA